MKKRGTRPGSSASRHRRGSSGITRPVPAAYWPHNVRNVINGWTPGIVVAFTGTRGTLAEIAFARAARKPVISAAGSVARLPGGCRPDCSHTRQRDKAFQPVAGGLHGQTAWRGIAIPSSWRLRATCHWLRAWRCLNDDPQRLAGSQLAIIKLS
ncbi:hypothetical protein [Inquilinus ginsengisoli]|uniref:SLOG cluster 4 domain-containing protein n=1 Tax=Inquilinus ginsengisoli TaxID=363840 RepID=UPI003D1D3ED2